MRKWGHQPFRLIVSQRGTWLASGINPVTSFDAKAEHEATAGVVGCHDVIAVHGYHHFALYSSGKPHNAVFGETCAWHVLEYPGLAAWKTPQVMRREIHNFGLLLFFFGVPFGWGFRVFPLFGLAERFGMSNSSITISKSMLFTNRGNMFTCRTASLATAVNSAPW